MKLMGMYLVFHCRYKSGNGGGMLFRDASTGNLCTYYLNKLFSINH